MACSSIYPYVWRTYYHQTDDDDGDEEKHDLSILPLAQCSSTLNIIIRRPQVNSRSFVPTYHQLNRIALDGGLLHLLSTNNRKKGDSTDSSYSFPLLRFLSANGNKIIQRECRIQLAPCSAITLNYSPQNSQSGVNFLHIMEWGLFSEHRNWVMRN